MNLRTEQYGEKQKILIVDKLGSAFSQRLKEKLERYDNEVFVSPKLPQNIVLFEACFLINESMRTLELLSNFHDKRFVFVFTTEKRHAEEFARQITAMKKHSIKVINIVNNAEMPDEDVDKMLWFSFTKSHETLLNFHYRTLGKQPLPIADKNPPRRKRHIITWKRVFIIAPLLFILIHIMFIPPLILGTYYVYKQTNSLREQNFEAVLDYNTKSASATELSKKLYTFARPIYLFFSLAFLPDNVFQIDDTANTVLKESVPLIKTSQAYVTLFMKKNKTDQDQELLFRQQKELQESVSQLHQDLSFLYQKLPEREGFLKKTKGDMKKAIEILDDVKKILPQMDKLFAKNGKRTYLMMFANNMELRPGGGFIGSFAVATVKDYGLDEMKVYDVYDADGQLKAHIDPPEPIRKYLGQPHWFLRDSAFSPDFPENYEQAKMFLSREMNFTHFDGGILITTSAIQHILEALGNLYIPDYNEVVNKDNFYLKAQLYAEKDFFPGSVQKKRFLSSVMNQLMLSLEDASYPKLVQSVDRALNEKQIVMYFEDEALQKAIDNQYWSGRVLSPVCTSSNPNCVVDFLMPVDANLGVNKANFFINRNVTLNVSVDTSGRIKNKYVMELRNDSFNNVFPGGTYKNYMQVELPRDATIREITKNGTLIEGYSESQTTGKLIGFYLEVPPQTSVEVVISYELATKVSNGKGIYQLIVQKQIGSSNYDFDFALTLPKNIFATNQNFSPLVKGNSIHYNTTIKADKIFYIELLKE